jgi:predicted nucleotidyltransferase
MPKTALELSPLEWKQYHPFKKNGKQKVRFSKIHQKDAIDIARKIARELGDRFSAQKVILFGSVARGIIHKRSDIDLAVWGIPQEDFYRAVAFAAGYSKDWKVDLVDAEDCRESLKQSISRDGVEL